MSKKILSLAVAVVMLISVFAFSASAANTKVETTFPSAGQAGYRVVSDAYVGMPAGEEVTVKVYFVFPTGTDYETLRVAFAGNTYLCYTDAFEVDTSTREFGESYWYMKGNVNDKATLFTTVSGKFNDADKAMGWTKCVMVQKSVDTTLDSGYTSTTGHPVEPYCELYSIKFTTTKTLTAADTIGIPSGCANAKSTTGTVAIGTKAPTSASLAAENIIFSEATAKADRVEVNDTETTKMRPGSADGKVDLGLTGTVMKAAFDAGKEWGAGCYVAPNLSNVGVQVRVNGVVQAAESGCIYELKDGRDGFNYRAVISDMNVSELSAEIEVRTYITDVNGNTYFSNWMGIDAASAYEAKFGA